MSNRYAIVSTYPRRGSRNIGDHLITSSLIELIREREPTAQIESVWRAEDWRSVEATLREVDHVFFACLAIRPQMHTREYPFLDAFTSASIPFSVHAAGTALPVHNSDALLRDFAEETVALLHRVHDEATVFTTRGILSQRTCEDLGLHRTSLAGDIAFADARFEDRAFASGTPIRRVVVSDPHMASAYLPSLRALIGGLRSDFVEASVVIALHGVNVEVERAAAKLGVDVLPIFEDPESGLDIYDDADLHVGFRVHGHVSALKRRKYSYLLEQDGRGCDYGLTLERKISVAHYQCPTPTPSARSLARWALGRGTLTNHAPSPSAVAQLLALIQADARDGFKRFAGMEASLRRYAEQNRRAVHSCLPSAAAL